MRMTDKAWTAHGWGVKERTVNDCTRGDSTVDEFFTCEADAWDAVAELNRSSAAHKELGASEDRKRERDARAKADSLREVKP